MDASFGDRPQTRSYCLRVVVARLVGFCLFHDFSIHLPGLFLLADLVLIIVVLGTDHIRLKLLFESGELLLLHQPFSLKRLLVEVQILALLDRGGARRFPVESASGCPSPDPHALIRCLSTHLVVFGIEHLGSGSHTGLGVDSHVVIISAF